MPDHLKSKMNNLIQKWTLMADPTDNTDLLPTQPENGVLHPDQHTQSTNTISHTAVIASKGLPQPPSTSQSFMQMPNEDKNVDLISNDLFDWLLWIDHTLQTHVITVGDFEETQQAINKYNVRLYRPNQLY
jgi:hypothetical protein